MKRTITISPDGTVTITEETEAPARILAPWPTTVPSVPWPTYTPPHVPTYEPVWVWDPTWAPTCGSQTATSDSAGKPYEHAWIWLDPYATGAGQTRSSNTLAMG